jgi:23S rRNA pseudouridine2605 synthase
MEAKPRHEERLQKIIAAAGVTSRRKAEELILGGSVQVNGQTVTELGSKADAAQDHIRVNGKLLKPVDRLRYFMLNKPKGYVTTVSDPEHRPTVMEFFQRAGTRVFPIGRLDYQSEGLLLMTNDGELANLLTKASSKVEKTYLVKISGKPSEAAVEQLRAGIMIDRGRKDSHEGRVLTQPAEIRLVRNADNPWYEVSLTEGRNRQIRKLFEEIGHFVEKIRRVGYGPLVLDVPPGEVRELTSDEVIALQRAARGIGTKRAEKSRANRAIAIAPAKAPRSAKSRIGRSNNSPDKANRRPAPRKP